MLKKITTTISIIAVLTHVTALLQTVLAAYLYVSPPQVNVDSGQSTTIGVYIHSPQEEMNAITGTLLLPLDQFSIISIDQSNTLIDFWTNIPSNTNGNIQFEGVIYNPGYKGTAGLVFTAQVQPLFQGTRTVSLQNTTVLANDGNGTNITETAGQGKVTVNPAPTITPIPTPTPTPLPVQDPISGILLDLPEDTSSITRDMIERLSTIPGIGDTVKKIAVNVVQFADQTETSTVALVTSLAILTAPSVITIATGLSSTINFLSLWHLPVAFSGLVRKRKKPWGIVYDAKTKEPLDPVIMTLREKSGKEYHTMTDLYGRYTFWVDPGEYELIAQKTNFVFPSKELEGKSSDGVYDDLYFGGKLTIEEDHPITVNIPMDQIKEDLNQIMKRKMGISAQKTTIYTLSSFIFYAGLAWSIISFALVPKMGNALILELFLITFLIRLFIHKNKSWGTIRDQRNKPMQNVITRLQNIAFPNVKFPPIVTRSLGRYSFLVEEGTYRVIIQKNDSDQSHLYQTEDIVIKKDIDYIAKDITLPSTSTNISSKRKILITLVTLCVVIGCSIIVAIVL